MSFITREHAASLLRLDARTLEMLYPEQQYEDEKILELLLEKPPEYVKASNEYFMANCALLEQNTTHILENELRVILRRDSNHTLENVHLHLGPTNSGKTHDALIALAQAGHGVYAGPLRMLAREAYEKLCDLAGVDQVGLITGEEKINVHAPIIAATAEAAPMRGKLLVLDETHWLSDPQRGWAWTRLLLTGKFDTMHIISDVAAEQLILALLTDAKEKTVSKHKRLTPLKFEGDKALLSLPPKTAVVCFSRKAVLAMANFFIENNRPVAVLYGALPPQARRDQVAKLTSGQVDIVVCTDVIGHGINLPIDAVALAETQKFDGIERRMLYLWESAQIVGRAGRFGYSKAGSVYTPTGLQWLSTNKTLTRNATDAAAGRVGTRWTLEKAQIRPTLDELGATCAEQLPVLLTAWSKQMVRATAGLPVALANIDQIVTRVQQIMLSEQGLGAALAVDLVWRLSTCPIDDPLIIQAGADALLGNYKAVNNLVVSARVTKNASLEAVEQAAGIARDLRALVGSVGDLPTLSRADAAQLEEKAAKAVSAALTHRMPVYGHCTDCGDECAPWFTHCDDCHRSQFRSYGRGFYYYEDEEDDY